MINSCNFPAITTNVAVGLSLDAENLIVEDGWRWEVPNPSGFFAHGHCSVDQYFPLVVVCASALLAVCASALPVVCFCISSCMCFYVACHVCCTLLVMLQCIARCVSFHSLVECALHSQLHVHLQC